MAMIHKITCPKCGEEYSALRPSCPKCGARKLGASYRASAQSDTARAGTRAQTRRNADSRWQLTFGLCLVLAVIIAVIVLITTTVKNGYNVYEKPSPSVEIEESPTPSPTPRPTPSPTPAVESVTITFLGSPKEGFAMDPGSTVQLGTSIYPVEIEGPVTWSSANEDICTVDSNGLVTGVSSGTTKVIARCYGAAAECVVWVR